MNLEPLMLFIHTLPEPTLLVTEQGEIRAANAPASALFQLLTTALVGQSLATLVANPPEQVSRYLQLWSRNRQLMPGMLMLRNAAGAVVRHQCQGAVVVPRVQSASATIPALLTLRLEKESTAASKFNLLTQKVEALSKEIRERLLAEQALRTSEERFRAVVEAVPNAIIVVNAVGQIVLANPQTERLFGYTLSELLHKRVEQLIPQRVRTQHESLRLAFQSTPQARPMGVGRDLYALCKDDSETPVEIGLNPFTTVEGNFVLVSIIDISARKQAEQQLQESEIRLRNLAATLEQRVQRRTAELERSNEDLNQFAYVASHDLKAPLRNVEQLAGFVVDDAAALLPPASQKHLAQLRERVKRMDRLLDDLLTYARIGRADGQVETVSVDALLVDVATFLAPPAGFRIQCVDAMPTLRTQRVPFELIMRNLISNAIKHHHQPSQGEVQISVRDLGDFFEFRLQDNGPGIEAQYHERIFGLFQTLKQRDQVEGSGMGLAIVKKAVERYGGIIRVQSASGTGTTFTFTWPKQIGYTPSI